VFEKFDLFPGEIPKEDKGQLMMNAKEFQTQLVKEGIEVRDAE
jgi:hypothetical protein